MYSVVLSLNSPLVGLLHLDGHVGHLLADLADELDHVLGRQRGSLRRLRKLRVQLQEFPGGEINVARLAMKIEIFMCKGHTYNIYTMFGIPFPPALPFVCILARSTVRKIKQPPLLYLHWGNPLPPQCKSYLSTASLSHLRTMLPESSSCHQPAQRPNHAT